MLKSVLALDHHAREVAALPWPQSMRLDTILRSRSRVLISVGVGEAEDVEGRLPAPVENLAMNHRENICVIVENPLRLWFCVRPPPLLPAHRPSRELRLSAFGPPSPLYQSAR